MKKSIVKPKRISAPMLLVVFLASLIILINYAGAKDQTNIMRLEARIGETLSRIDGVGEVEVIIRTRIQQSQGKSLMSTYSDEEIPCGALVTAKGADDPLIRIKIIHALCALLGLQQADVDVIGLGEEVN